MKSNMNSRAGRALVLIVTVIIYSTVICTEYDYDFLYAFGRENQSKSKLSSGLDIQEIKTQIIKVGDIDIAYKKFGKGCGARFNSEAALVDLTLSPKFLACEFNRSRFSLSLLPIYKG